MGQKEIKKSNLRNLYAGNLFLSASGILVSLFLALFLKREGLGVLDIGLLFTAGLALGSLLVSFMYSDVLRKIKLKTGMILSSVLAFFQSFIFFLIPTSFGALVSKPVGEARYAVEGVSEESVMQHNSSKNSHRSVMSYGLVIESLGLVFGIVLSVLLVKWVGFELSFLLFAILALPSIFFFSRIKEESRFKLKKGQKLPKLSKKLKMILSVEMIYWVGLGATAILVDTFLIVDKFEGSMVWLAVIFGSLHLSTMITTYLTEKYFDKSNFAKTSLMGMAILLLSAIIIIISPSIHFALAAFIIEGIGAGIWVPSKTALVWKHTQKENREKVAGRVQGIRMFVQAFGPLVGGGLASVFGILGPFYFKAILSVLAILSYLYIWKNFD